SCSRESRFAAMAMTFSSRVGYSTHPETPSLRRVSARASSIAVSLRRSGTRITRLTKREARAIEASSSITQTARDAQALVVAPDHHGARGLARGAHMTGRAG